MKKNFLVISLLLITVLACNVSLPQTQGQGNLPLSEDAVPRVTVDEAKAAYESGEAIIVDVRSSEAYAGGHITGAISIPLDQFESNIANAPLDKNKWIITYCT
jgi:3-mercaptopyruvate sulfurtransferase SseA